MSKEDSLYAVGDNLSVEQLDKLLRKCHDGLTELSEYNNAQCLTILKAVAEVYAKYSSKRTKCAQVLVACNFCELCMKILISLDSKGLMSTDDIWFPAYYIFANFSHFSAVSDEFTQSLFDAGASKKIIGYLQNDAYNNYKKNTNVSHLVKTSLTILHNISKLKLPKQTLRDQDALTALEPFLKSDNEIFKVTSLMSWTELIIDDSDFNAHLDKYGAIPLMWEFLCKSLTAPKRRHKGFSPVELTRCLTRMSVTNTNKTKIIEAETLPLLMKMMKHDDDEEKYRAAELLWSLAFDKKVRSQIKEESECVELLEQLLHSDNDDVRYHAAGALWMVQDKMNCGPDEDESDQPASTARKHVYIIYSKEDVKLCTKIKEKLEKDDNTVCMSTDILTLDEMLVAVHNAYIVLFCTSEHYKFNLRCRIESEYSMKLGKKYGRCQVTDYRPDGSLLECLGEGQYFNLYDEDTFEDATDVLLKCVKKAIEKQEEEDKGDENVEAFRRLMALLLQSANRGNSSSNSDDETSAGAFSLEDGLSDKDLDSYVRRCVKELQDETDYAKPKCAAILKELGTMADKYIKKKECYSKALIEVKFHEVASRIVRQLFGGGDINDNKRCNSIKQVLNTLYRFTDVSTKFAKCLADTGVVFVLNEACLMNDAFLKDLNNPKIGSVVLSTLCVIYNISLEPTAHNNLRRAKTFQAMQPFTKSTNDSVKILAVMTIVAIMDDDEKAEHQDNGAIPAIINFIEQAINLPSRKFRGFTPQELAKGLEYLAVSDRNKMAIVDAGTLPLFVKMMQSDNVEEQQVAAKVIWTLAFDKNARARIKEESECVDTLKTLQNSSSGAVKHNANGALWVILEKTSSSSASPGTSTEPKSTTGPSSTSATSPDDTEGNHVFISYSQSDQDMCVKIKEHLEADGYRVWMDIDKMGGSTLEAMAKAVENAAVVLICTSEKYKLSNNCRTEAEYTHQLSKDIVPLMMERHYKPDGWLGLLLGAKFYVNFDGKFKFDEAYPMLIRELGGRGKAPVRKDSTADTGGQSQLPQPTSTSASKPTAKSGKGATAKSAVCSWSKDNVQTWLKHSNLNRLKDAFKDYDGEMIQTLQELYQEVPTFFFESLKSDMGLTFTEIVLFTKALKSADTACVRPEEKK